MDGARVWGRGGMEDWKEGTGIDRIPALGNTFHSRGWMEPKCVISETDGTGWIAPRHTYREIFLESWQSKLNLDCNCTFSIVLASNRIPFVSKSVRKW